jgi:biotin carboxylase
MREVASRCGLTKGRYSAVNNLADIEAFMGDVPIVLKPRSRHAPLGVVRINTREEISTGWQQAQASHQQGGLTQGRDLHWDYMVEDFVTGFEEFSLETLIRDGKVVFSNITRKMMDASRHFSPVGHVVPACVSKSVSETLRNAENSFLRCIEVADGFVHSEWIVTECGPHLIEFAVRFPGGGLSRLVEYVYGINLAEAWVRLLAGREIPPHKRPGAVSAVLYFNGREGRLI